MVYGEGFTKEERQAAEARVEQNAKLLDTARPSAQPTPQSDCTFEQIVEHCMSEALTVGELFDQPKNLWSLSGFGSPDELLLREILERTIYVDPKLDPTDPEQEVFLELPERPSNDWLREVRLINTWHPERIGMYAIPFKRDPHGHFQNLLRHMAGKTWFMEAGYAPLMLTVYEYLKAAGYWDIPSIAEYCRHST